MTRTKTRPFQSFNLWALFKAVLGPNVKEMMTRSKILRATTLLRWYRRGHRTRSRSYCKQLQNSSRMLSSRTLWASVTPRERMRHLLLLQSLSNCPRIRAIWTRAQVESGDSTCNRSPIAMPRRVKSTTLTSWRASMKETRLSSRSMRNKSLIPSARISVLNRSQQAKKNKSRRFSALPRLEYPR